MAIPVWRKLILVAGAVQMGLAGCSTPGRLPAVPTASIPQASTGLGQIRYLVARETDTFAADAYVAMQREQGWLASQGQTGPLPPAYYLAISGGGDNGAFGAGLLNGWTAAGTRPEFKLVTGVSTGSLIAPFAFLGPKYDYVLERVYTQTSQKDIFKKRGMIKGFFADGMADTSPLASIIASYVNQPFLDEIAAEYAKGRVLLVGTANLDSLEPVIWNMTAIAASKDPRSLGLFRKILLASASIPGAFPPVMIDVEVNGTRYQEMHVDGGTMAQVFLFPPSISVSRVAKVERKRVAYIIRNARLDADWASVERRTLPIAARAIGSLTTTQGIGDLYRIFSTTQKEGIDFNLAYIPRTFNVPHTEEFDTNYMRQLYATGRQMAEAGYNWQKYPPGYESPRGATEPSGK
ncbi:patatin-like phospholipase family protein [Sphingomonas sp. G124]|uniref:Patatin-like phospholipase family protein n=1 Tax=Sphingomonas cremea TaxID=2904799 RepID=A0A9X1QKC6_9SPHN|nr:patatin-like phospholipase family protein [Sphingomonas cremea]MCF2515221.1 patatin-like phospholipase family protein [Sphingomonas cremea]